MNAQNYLAASDLKLIQQHSADYKYASGLVGIPPLILIAIHYRESNLLMGEYSKRLKKVFKNVGGPLMLDCGYDPGGLGFNKRIRDYEIKVYRLYFGKGQAPRINKDFRFACVVAAYELKEKLRSSSWTWESMQDAAWGYNGRVGNIKDSAYLWSDPLKGVRLIVHYRNRRGELVEFKDTRPGVMVIYRELLEARQAGLI